MSRSPTFCGADAANGDATLAAPRMTSLATGNPQRAAVPVGGWRLVTCGTSVAPVPACKTAVDSGAVSVVFAGTLPVESQGVQAGAAGLMGQRPFEMGEKALDILLPPKKGASVQSVPLAGLGEGTLSNTTAFGEP